MPTLNANWRTRAAVTVATDYLDSARRDVGALLGEADPIAQDLAEVGDRMREIAVRLDYEIARRSSR